MQSAYLQFKHPNILRTSDELSPSNFFLGSIIPKTPEMKKLVLGMIDPRKKFGSESSSEVRKMLGCLNCKYADCIFIRRRLLYIFQLFSYFEAFQSKNVIFYNTVKEGTLIEHIIMAIGFEEIIGTYLNNKYVRGSLLCVGSPGTRATYHTLANWLKMFVFFFFFTFCFFFPHSLVAFTFSPDRKHIIFLMRLNGCSSNFILKEKIKDQTFTYFFWYRCQAIFTRTKVCQIS